MRIISKPILREFWKQNPNSKIPLLDWYKQSKKSDWKNIADAKGTFPHADSVGKCTIFNIGGNKFRLVTKINYKTRIIYIRFILTHKEYDKGKWREDCRS